MVTSDTRKGEILLTDLTKSYGDVKAVRGVTISINPGETLALLGPNGAGKSTTIDMMLGLTRPDSGTVSLFGATPAEAVQAGRSALGGGNAWPGEAWIVLAVWSIVSARLAARVYRRDTARV
jgi:ABC-type lipopolysaccharide export system ATPase subunit